MDLKLLMMKELKTTLVSKICDPSKYQLNAIDPSFTPSVGFGNDAVAIPVNVATPITPV